MANCLEWRAGFQPDSVIQLPRPADWLRKKNDPPATNNAAARPPPRKSTPGTNRFSYTGPSISVTGSFTMRVTEFFVHPVFGPLKNQNATTASAITSAATRNFVLTPSIQPGFLPTLKEF